MKRGFELVEAFIRDEEGVALTEYLILLGLLIGAVIGAVLAAGVNLASAWQSWGSFWTNNVSYSG